MHSSEIAGFAYEAALHCVACAETRFGADRLFAGTAIDREGNYVSPVFAGDEPGDSGDYCDDCHEPLDNMPDDWDTFLLEEFIRANRADMLTDLADIVACLKEDMAADPALYTEHGADSPSIDVRLCVDINHCRDSGTWIIRTGSADYDPRHSEYCSSGAISPDTDPNDLLDDLIDQLGN
jgi:hypothetical protein